MTSSEENTTSRLALPNDMTSCRSAQNTMLSHEKLLDAICSTDLRNQLYDLRIPVSPITANDQKAACDALGNREKDTRDEGFTVVRLLENDDLFPQTRTARRLVFR